MKPGVRVVDDPNVSHKWTEFTTAATAMVTGVTSLRCSDVLLRGHFRVMHGKDAG